MAKTGFRETMWFKLGDNVDDGGEETPVPLPIEDRYSGGVTAEDTQAYGLHSGTTEYLRVIVQDDANDVPMTKLVGEMKHSKRRLFAVGASIVAAGAAFALYLI